MHGLNSLSHLSLLELHYIRMFTTRAKIRLQIVPIFVSFNSFCWFGFRKEKDNIYNCIPTREQ